MNQIAPLNDDPLEAFTIANPWDRQYKFLFKAYFTQPNIDEALAFTRRWCADHEYEIKREKTRNIPEHTMFEVIIWLF